MTDPALVSKKLALIESCLSDLQRLARPEAIDTDVRERRFVEHTLQMAIQAALNVASHLVSDGRLGEPRTNRELFDLLHRDGWIDADLTAILRNMAASAKCSSMDTTMSMCGWCATCSTRTSRTSSRSSMQSAGEWAEPVDRSSDGNSRS